MPARTGRNSALLRQEDTQLVVTDVQESLLKGIWERDALVRNILLLVEAARVLRLPVVPTVQNAERLGATIPELAKRFPTHCVPFDKMCFSSAEDDAFLSELSRNGRRQALLCGVEAHICICQTALDLVTLGYQVQVAADAVSSRTESNWRVGLDRMQQAGVLITSAETAIYELLGEAGTPEFREILALVK